jgi:hypothetical protein
MGSAAEEGEDKVAVGRQRPDLPEEDGAQRGSPGDAMCDSDGGSSTGGGGGGGLGRR